MGDPTDLSKREPNLYGDRTTLLWCGRKVGRPGDRHAVLTGVNRSQRDFSRPAETVH
jgi:hypothetical protein